jgi:hypothetical protein
MALHKYKIGQLVEFLPRSRDSNIPRGQYKIQRQLPSDSGVLQYRVKHAADGHERVVIETQISATSTPMSERASVFERMPPRGDAD